MLKKIAIAFGLIIVVAVVAIAAAVVLTPTDFQVEREITINRPKDEVFAYAKVVKNQNVWGPWYKRDPAMKQEFVGTDGMPGFVSKWESQNPEVGSGEQEIKNIIDGQRLETELRFKEPFQSKADAYLTVDAIGEGQTKVKWGFASAMPRPMNVMLLFIDMDQAVGKDFEEGLAGLKAELEK